MRPLLASLLTLLCATHVQAASSAAAGTAVRDDAGATLHAQRLIPPFSRRYRTSCSTCHVSPGKLNSQGDAFRQYGFRFPDDDERLRHDRPVPLGAEPWKDVWPDAIWPGELPGELPLSLYFVNELRVGRSDDAQTRARFVFPAALALQSATTLGDGIAAFAEITWRAGAAAQVGEVRAMVHDPLPFLPPRTLNLWLGNLRPHLLTLGDLSLDRVARHPFLWQRLTLADWPVHAPAADSALDVAPFRLTAIRPTLELNGLARGRFHYALGFTQPAGARSDERAATDVYFKLRVKLRGMGFDGSTPTDADAWGGQLLDRGVVLEHFAYRGASTGAAGQRDEHRAAGVAVRLLERRSDIGVGYIWARDSDPWNVAELGARHASAYGRAEYMLLPWVIGSLKADHARIRLAGAAAAEFGTQPLERARLMPGLTLLLRPNVRVVAEGEYYLRDRPRSGPAGEPGHTLWLRLDAAF